jgi:hypothetical protein
VLSDRYATTVAEAICEPLCGFLGVAFHPGPTAATLLGTAEEDDFMALFDSVAEFKAAVREIVHEELQTMIGTVIEGDPGTQDGGSHPHNLRNINRTVTKIDGKLPE